MFEVGKFYRKTEGSNHYLPVPIEQWHSEQFVISPDKENTIFVLKHEHVKSIEHQGWDRYQIIVCGEKWDPSKTKVVCMKVGHYHDEWEEVI